MRAIQIRTRNFEAIKSNFKLYPMTINNTNSIYCFITVSGRISLRDESLCYNSEVLNKYQLRQLFKLIKSF